MEVFPRGETTAALPAAPGASEEDGYEEGDEEQEELEDEDEGIVEGEDEVPPPRSGLEPAVGQECLVRNAGAD